MEAKVKHIIAFVKSIDIEQRRVRFVISSDKIDRDQERIETSAIAAAIPAFSKNPAALACHLHRLDNGEPPVIGSWDTDSFKALAHTTEMDLVFATTDLADKYFNLYSNKHMRAVSIGFFPQEWHREGNEKDGKVYVITKLELLEISCVAVGSNRQALSKIKGFYLEQDKAAESKGTDITITEHINKLFEGFEEKFFEQLDEIKSIIIPDPDGLAKSFLSGDRERPDPAGKSLSGDSIKKILNKVTANFKG